MDYIISWKHRKDYGSKGVGLKRFTKQEAEDLASELNRDYPHIEHTAIPEAEGVERFPSRDR